MGLTQRNYIKIGTHGLMTLTSTSAKDEFIIVLYVQGKKYV